MTNLPEYDLDGSRFEYEPSEEEIAEAEKFQKQSAEWVLQGKCAGCGGEHNGRTFPSEPTVFYCHQCMNDYETCMDDAR